MCAAAVVLAVFLFCLTCFPLFSGVSESDSGSYIVNLLSLRTSCGVRTYRKSFVGDTELLIGLDIFAGEDDETVERQPQSDVSNGATLTEDVPGGSHTRTPA